MSFRLWVTFVTGLILFGSTAASGQKDSVSNSGKVTANRISFDLGFNWGYFKDLGYSPLNYTETGTVLSLTYIRRKPQGKHIFTTDIDFVTGKTKSGQVDFFNAQLIEGNIEFSYLWKLSRAKEKKLSFFLGPQYNSFIRYVGWNDQESWTYLVTHGLNVKAFAEFKPSDKRFFQTSLSIPVFQILVRPPYNGYDLYIQQNSEDPFNIMFRGEPASFDKYFAMDWKTTYTYSASEHLDFFFGYLFRYQRVSGYNKLTHFQNQLTVGFIAKF